MSVSTIALGATEQVAGAALNVSAQEIMTLGATCAFFGGDKPLNPSTLYRGIKEGRYPRPVHPAPRLSRWLRSECVAALQAIIDARDVEQEAA